MIRLLVAINAYRQLFSIFHFLSYCFSVTITVTVTNYRLFSYSYS